MRPAYTVHTRGWVQARAFAEAVASASTCDCAVSVASEITILEDIFVEAATNAYAETCSCTPRSPVPRHVTHHRHCLALRP